MYSEHMTLLLFQIVTYKVLTIVSSALSIGLLIGCVLPLIIDSRHLRRTHSNYGYDEHKGYSWNLDPKYYHYVSIHVAHPCSTKTAIY